MKKDIKLDLSKLWLRGYLLLSECLWAKGKTRRDDVINALNHKEIELFQSWSKPHNVFLVKNHARVLVPKQTFNKLKKKRKIIIDKNNQKYLGVAYKLKEKK